MAAMRSPYPIAQAIGFAAVLAAGTAAAEAVDTPQCRRDLTTANRLIQGIAAREKRFVAGDLAKNCKLLRQNLADMSGARGPLDRCLTGHERGETVAQMDASIEDIRAVLADKCPQ
jgi:hypothetical protein